MTDSLDSFFEPIQETTVFGNNIEDKHVLIPFHLENTSGCSTSAEAEPQDEELIAIETSMQKARGVIEENLSQYHKWKDQQDVYQKLQKLIQTTLDDLNLRLRFLKDAFEKRFPEQSPEDAIRVIEEKVVDLKDTMLTPVDARVHEAEEHIRKAKRKLQAMTGFVNLTRNLSLAHMCPICYQEEVSVYCDPCGHTFCLQCVKSNYCYLCRTKINKVMKLYFT